MNDQQTTPTRWEEDAVAELMREATAGLQTDPEAIFAASERQGRAIRRRRRAATGAMAAVALAAVGGVGFGLVHGFGTGPRVGAAAPGPVVPKVTVVTPRPGESTAGGGGPTVQIDPPMQQLDARTAAYYLSRLSPDGARSDFTGQDSLGELYAAMKLDLGEGKVGVEINVQGHFFDPPVAPKAKGGKDGGVQIDDIFTCKDPELATCKVTRNPDGTLLRQATQKVQVVGSKAIATVVSVNFLRTDKTRVLVLTGDSLDVKYGGTPRKGLDVADATKIATSPRWDLYTAPSAQVQAAAKRTIKPWTLIDGSPTEATPAPKPKTKR